MQVRKRWRLPDDRKAAGTDEIETPRPLWAEKSDSSDTPFSSRLFDISTFHPEDLRTEEDCVFAMIELDKLVAVVDAQIRRAHTQRWRTGAFADRDWYNEAQQKLRAAKVARNLAQEQRGLLRRDRKAKEHAAAERRFITAAKVLLPKEQYAAIWDAAIAAPDHIDTPSKNRGEK